MADEEEKKEDSKFDDQEWEDDYNGQLFCLFQHSSSQIEAFKQYTYFHTGYKKGD